jgi:hypothetical protein
MNSPPFGNAALFLPHDGINLKRNHSYQEDSRTSIGTFSLGKIFGKIFVDKYFESEYK